MTFGGGVCISFFSIIGSSTSSSINSLFSRGVTWYYASRVKLFYFGMDDFVLATTHCGLKELCS